MMRGKISWLLQLFILIPICLLQNCNVNFQDLSETSSTSSNTESTTAAADTGIDYTWDFSSSGDYSISDSDKIALSSGAVLQLVDQTHSIASDFSGGTHMGTQYTASTLTIDSTKPNQLDATWAPQWANIESYWKFDETSWTGVAGEVEDAVNGRDGVRSGNATTTGLAKAGSYAGIFDGNTDYVTVANNAAYNVTATGLSLSFWARRADNVTTNLRYFSNGSTANNEDGYTAFGSNDYVSIGLSDGSTRSYVGCNLGTDSFVDTWRHVVVVFDSTNMKVYLDGYLCNTNAHGFTLPINSSSPFYFGRSTSSQYYDGILDEFVVWSVALTADDVADLYYGQNALYSGYYTSAVIDTGTTSSTWTLTSWITELPFFKELTGTAGSESSTNYSSLVGSTGATSDNDLMSGILGLWHFNETVANSAPGATDFEDSSGNSNHLNEVNTPLFGQTGLFSNSAFFDGTADYATTSASNTFIASANQPFTVSAWVNPTTISASATADRIITIHRGAAAGSTFALSLGNSNKVNYYNFGGGGTISSTGIIETLKWSNISISYSGTCFQLYINGVADGACNVLPLTAGGTYPAYISSYNGGDGMNGYLDELAFWNRELHADEVTQLYRRGANRIKLQVRSCDDSACSGEVWSGPDGSEATYFSELNNCDLLTAATGACDFSGGGDVNLTSPSLTYSDYSSLSVPTNQYYQYRVIMESDDDTSSTVPTLSSLTIGPAHYYGDSPTISTLVGPEFTTWTSFTTTEAGTCTITYQISNDGTNWKYFDSSNWVAASGVGQSNSAADVNTNASSFVSDVGTGTLYVKAFLSSDSSQDCTLTDMNVVGEN